MDYYNETTDSKTLIKIIKVLERDIILLYRIKKILELYSGKKAIYPLNNTMLIHFSKLLKDLNIPFFIKDEKELSLKIDKAVWGEHYNLLVIDLTNLNKLSSYVEIKKSDI